MDESTQNLQDQETMEANNAEEQDPARRAEEEASDQTEDPRAVSPYAELTPEELREALALADERRSCLEKQLEEAQSEATAAETEILRMAADFQNARKRLDRIAHEQVSHAKEGLITKLLAVLDDLDLAEANAPTDLNSIHDTWFKGVTQIREKILAVFQDEGVQSIETEGAFDPNHHEAVQMIPSEEHDSGHIVETLRKGYRRGEKVIRPAMVRIAA